MYADENFQGTGIHFSSGKSVGWLRPDAVCMHSGAGTTARLSGGIRSIPSCVSGAALSSGAWILSCQQ